MKKFLPLLLAAIVIVIWMPGFSAAADETGPTPEVSGEPSKGPEGSSNTNIDTGMIPGVAVPVPGPTGETSRGFSGGATVPGLPGAVVISPGQAAPGTAGMAPGIAPGGMGMGGGIGGGVGSGGGL